MVRSVLGFVTRSYGVYREPITFVAALVSTIAITISASVWVLESSEREKRTRWEAWRILNSAQVSRSEGGRRDAILDLLHAGAPLSGTDLSLAIIPELQIENTELYNVKFNEFESTGAKIRSVVLRKAQLDKAMFSHSSFTETQLVQSTLGQAKFNYCRFDNVIFAQTEGREAHFNNDSTFVESEVRNSYFPASEFHSTTFERCRIVHSNFTSADFHRATLNDVDWITTDAIDAVFLNVKGRIRVVDSNMRRVLFQNADIEGSVFLRSGLSEARFVKATLHNTRFDGAILTKADFTYADLTGAYFEGCDISNADFSKADLTNVTMKNVTGFASAIFNTNKTKGFVCPDCKL